MPAREPVHYGWVVIAAGTLTLFACIGIGRFGLSMLLPAMGETLGLRYAEMGLVSTSNLAGYLAAVYAVRFVVRRLGARRTIFCGLALVALGLMGLAAAHGFVTAALLCAATGIGSGIANVPMMGLVSLWFARRHRGKAAGYMVAGNGLAIVYAGLLVPAINAARGADGWRAGWLALAATALACAVIAGLLIRNQPSDLALAPVGAAAEGGPPDDHHGALPAAAYRRLLAEFGALYALFGASYVIYTTFIVLNLVADHGFSEAVAGRLWAWIGGLSMLSGPLFGALSDRIGRRAGFAVVFSLQATAYALAAAGVDGVPLYLSVGLFGIVAWSIPSIMAAAVGDYMGASHAADAFGTITVIFGLGQIAGPAIAGAAADATGGFAASFAIAGGLAGLAIALSLKLRPPPPAVR